MLSGFGTGLSGSPVLHCAFVMITTNLFLSVEISEASQPDAAAPWVFQETKESPGVIRDFGFRSVMVDRTDLHGFFQHPLQLLLGFIRIDFNDSSGGGDFGRTTGHLGVHGDLNVSTGRLDDICIRPPGVVDCQIGEVTKMKLETRILLVFLASALACFPVAAQELIQNERGSGSPDSRYFALNTSPGVTIPIGAAADRFDIGGKLDLNAE